ncbi:MAG TPA: Flp pilus assembly protein CpaB [Symbiobacteriaceae bacterium]|nr:Flp pilus assembly protein CpaB [Symbiobacteriaceae bacterium]
MRQRSGGMVILVVSIVAGLIAALLSVSFLKGVARSTTVLVATQEIPAFTPLAASMFTVEQMPSSAVPADAVADVSALTGRYARTIILRGTVIRQGHLATSSGSTGSLAAKLTETGQAGMRALAIPVDNATGVGGTIQAGDKVDVIAAVRVERQNAPATILSKVIGKAIPVLHRTEAEGTSKATVVVMVTPSQAEEIAYAQLAGTIYLATNPYRVDLEAEKANTTGVTPDSFLQRYGR